MSDHDPIGTSNTILQWTPPPSTTAAAPVGSAYPAPQAAAVIHSTAPEAYAAQQQAYAEQQAHAAQQANAAQQAYATQQQAYATQQQTYAEQQAYADQQLAYAQQQQVYAQQQQGYSAEQQAYAQQQQGYSAEQQAYAHQQQAYAQQPQGYSAAPQGYSPAPQGHSAAPQGYSAGPQGYSAGPQGYSAQQQSPGYAQHQGFSPQHAMPAYAGAGPGSGRPIPNADATAGAAPRLRFIRLTYLHLLGAILVFAGAEYLLMNNETVFMKVSVPILRFALGGGRYNWLAFLGIFMVVGYLADYWARSASSRALQYVGLGVYAVAEAVIFLPLLFIAEIKAAEIAAKSGQHVHLIRDSAVLTIALFSALTASVLISKKDFSFLRSGLMMGSAAAFGIIVLAIVGGFNLGLVFSIAMVILAAGYVLYYTSQVLAHYHPGQHVAAALALFSAVALMFWYIIRIMMKLRE